MFHQNFNGTETSKTFIKIATDYDKYSNSRKFTDNFVQIHTTARFTDSLRLYFSRRYKFVLFFFAKSQKKLRN